MTKYIAVDELVNELHEHFSNGFDGDEWWNSTHVLTAIERTPTVDVVPVIRCKDCKHSEPWYRDRMRCSMWDEEGNLVCVWDDGFCSYAERKEDETS